MKTCQFNLKHLIAAISLAAFLPAFAHAQTAPEGGHEGCKMPPPGHHGMPDELWMDGPVPPFVHGLELTEAQRDAIFNIMHAQVPLLRDKMKSLHKSQEALHALTLSSQYDETKAKVLAEAVADDMAVLSLLRAQSEHQIYVLLTPEQRKQAAEIKAKFDFHLMNHCDGKSQADARSI